MKDALQFKIILEKDGEGQTRARRFQVGPDVVEPDNLLKWFKDHLGGPAVQAVLDFFYTESEDNIWSSIGKDVDEFANEVRDHLNRPIEREDLGGAIHITKVGEGPLGFTVHGRVVFEVESDEEE